MQGTFAWIKTLPPALQSLIYAIETGLIAALVIFLTSVYSAIQLPHGLESFDWAGQVKALELGAIAAIIKAVLDYLKDSPPSQAATKP